VRVWLGFPFFLIFGLAYIIHSQLLQCAVHPVLMAVAELSGIAAEVSAVGGFPVDCRCISTPYLCPEKAFQDMW